MTYLPTFAVAWFTMILVLSPVSVESFGIHPRQMSSLVLSAVSTDDTSTATNANISTESLKADISKKIEGTSRGLSASTKEMVDIDGLVQSLEARCPLSEPARSPLMGGKWIVDYTTAPPPSNGKLGPFVGIARQIIDLEKGTYTNYLSVPGDIEKEWLSARLEATFEEWDGVLLEDDRATKRAEAIDESENSAKNEETAEEDEAAKSSNWFQSLASAFQGQSGSQSNKKVSSPDYGAQNWKVDFKTLTIEAFGIQIVQKQFDEGTSRVWKMSYLDEEGTRIVRAGRTGSDEDAMLFYMQREE